MNVCPSCRRAVTEGDWFCPHCAAQLKDQGEIDDQVSVAKATTIVEELFPILDPGHFTDEVTSTLAWRRAPEMLTGEALIVGELTGQAPLDPAMFATLEAIAATTEGTSQLLLYADSSSTKLLSPAAVPRLARSGSDEILTPYEEYLVTYVNGRRTIRELQEAGLLAPDEMTATILTLIDRGLITLAPIEGGATLFDRTEVVDEASLAEALLVTAPPRPLESSEPSPIALDPSALIPIEPTPVPPPTKPVHIRPPPVAAPVIVSPDRPGAPSHKQATKAGDLYRAALRDRSVGNLISARMNLKLAIAFDPRNREYQDAFRALADAPATNEAPPAPLHPAAAKLFEEASKAESNGELDRTIRLLERALLASKEPVVMNRLGVILATRKHEYRRAQELLEAAVEIDPHNAAYVHNLGKVLAAAAVEIEAHKGGDPKKGRLLSYWDRLRGKNPKSRA